MKNGQRKQTLPIPGQLLIINGMLSIIVDGRHSVSSPLLQGFLESPIPGPNARDNAMISKTFCHTRTKRLRPSRPFSMDKTTRGALLCRAKMMMKSKKSAGGRRRYCNQGSCHHSDEFLDACHERGIHKSAVHRVRPPSWMSLQTAQLLRIIGA
jgi:hypothetical protein